MNKKKITLSIESAIEGGSISLKKNSIEIDFWVGQKAVSRSEDLLAEIEHLLIKNKVDKKDVELIGVAESIGSLTGLRIGYSTALGLKRAIGCKLQTFSVITSAANRLAEENSLISIFLNESTVYFQAFRIAEGTLINSNNIKIASAKEVLEQVWNSEFESFFVNQKFLDFISTHSIKIPKNTKLNNLGRNLSFYFEPNKG